MVNNWKSIAPVFGWCMSLFPLDIRGEMTDYEVVCAITNRINQLIKNNEVLPDFIEELIKQYVTEGELSKVLSDLLGEFMLNAKFPPSGLEPAVGDGSKNDTVAIQGIIEYAANKGGGAVFLPSGKYLVDNLTLKENVSIIGQDRYSTELVLTGGASDSLVKSTENNIAIQNVTLNGNAGIQVNELTLVSLNCNNVLIDNVIVKNAYAGVSFNGGGHLQISNVIFQNAVTSLLYLEGSAKVQVVNCEFAELSRLSGLYSLFIGTDGGQFDFLSYATVETACRLTGNDNVINATIINATNAIIDNGLRNSYKINGTEEKKYLTGDFDETVNGAYTSHVNGARTVNVGGNETKVVQGSTGFRSIGAYTEEYNSTHTVNAENQIDTENVGRKNINADDIVLNPNNPLTYKKPEKLSNIFNYVEFKDNEGNTYNVLTEGEIDYNGVNITIDGTADKPSVNIKTGEEELVATKLDSMFIHYNQYNNIQKEIGTDIRIASFNCQTLRTWFDKGISAGIEQDIKTIKKILDSGCDVIGLQECRVMYNETIQDRLTNYKLPYASFRQNVLFGFSQYGTALLSSAQITNTGGGLYPSVASMEDRGWQKIVTTVKGKTISVYNTHIGLSDEQIIGNLNSLFSVVSVDPSDYIFICGDYNADPSSQGFTQFINNEFKISNTDVNTFPTSGPNRVVDNILYKGNIQLTKNGVIDTTGLSDHMLYYADFKLS